MNAHNEALNLHRAVIPVAFVAFTLCATAGMWKEQPIQRLCHSVCTIVKQKILEKVHLHKNYLAHGSVNTL